MRYSRSGRKPRAGEQSWSALQKGESCLLILAQARPGARQPFSSCSSKVAALAGLSELRAHTGADLISADSLCPSQRCTLARPQAWQRKCCPLSGCSGSAAIFYCAVNKLFTPPDPLGSANLRLGGLAHCIQRLLPCLVQAQGGLRQPFNPHPGLPPRRLSFLAQLVAVLLFRLSGQRWPAPKSHQCSVTPCISGINLHQRDKGLSSEFSPL